jgi:biotin-(acetyl-CoA carboxylase) ligase
LFNALESFIEKLEKGRDGWEEIVQLYYKYWLHTNQQIKIRTDESCDAKGESVYTTQEWFWGISKYFVTGNFHEVGGVIRRLDENGYLVVELTDSGQMTIVMPNGNSLDMMQGLIAPKKVR